MALDITHDDNIVLPAGKVLFRPLDSDGNFTDGFRFIGNCPGLTINVSSESVQHYKSHTRQKEQDVDVTTQVTRGGSITIDDITPDNLVFAIVGETEDVSISSDTGVTETLSGVNQGRFYQLGETVEDTGVRNVSSVSVTGSGGSPSHSASTDYIIHAQRGLIEIVEGGGISDSDDIEVTFDHTGETWTRVVTTGDGKLKGAIKYISNNREGAERDYYMPKTEIRPDGDFSLVSDDDSFQQISGALSLNTDANGNALYIDGVPAAP